MSQAVTGNSSSSSSMQAAKLRLGLTAGLRVAEVSHGGHTVHACEHHCEKLTCCGCKGGQVQPHLGHGGPLPGRLRGLAAKALPAKPYIGPSGNAGLLFLQ
jgi:hypothetical protein